MNEINELLKYGESEKVEFKKSTAQLEKGLKAVCGFLNHRGGGLYFGIHEGKVIGQDVSDSTLRSISQKIRQKIKPEVSPEITVLGACKKNIIKVGIEGGINRLYYLDGVAYKRIGTENVIIPPDEIERIIIEKKSRSWGSEISEEAGPDDIDEKTVRWFLREARIQRGLNILENTSVEEALMKLNLTRDGKLTNAAALLFGKLPQDFFIQSEIKCIRFKGDEPVKPFIDFQVIEGNIIEQINEAEKFVLRNIQKSVFPAEKGVQRTEKYQYPPWAIREAITNAVVHRDYENPSKVQVRVFDDRIEIWNPGTLISPLTLDDLRKPHKSFPRNPLLARGLFRIKYIEEVGTGTNDIIRECNRYGLPEPEFKIIAGDFVIVFRLPPLLENLKKLGLNERQIAGVNYVLKQGGMGNKEYRELNKVSRYTASRDLVNLVKKGVLKSTDTGKRKLKYSLLTQDASKMRQKMRQKDCENMFEKSKT